MWLWECRSGSGSHVRLPVPEEGYNSKCLMFNFRILGYIWNLNNFLAGCMGSVRRSSRDSLVGTSGGSSRLLWRLSRDTKVGLIMSWKLDGCWRLRQSAGADPGVAKAAGSCTREGVLATGPYSRWGWLQLGYCRMLIMVICRAMIIVLRSLLRNI